MVCNISIGLLMLAAMAVTGTARADGDYIWCVMQDSVDNRPRSIYSAVFRGDWSAAQTYESAFWNYIDSHVGLGYSPQVTCSREDSLSRAQQARDDDAAQARMRFDRQVVFTYWSH